MRFAESERDDFAFQLGTIANAHDVQILLKTLGNALHGIRYKRARQAMKRAVLFGIAKSCEHRVFLFERNAVRQWHNELAFRPLHVDLTGMQRDFNACGNGNWFASDT
jgi:hypothetical protein